MYILLIILLKLDSEIVIVVFLYRCCACTFLISYLNKKLTTGNTYPTYYLSLSIQSEQFLHIFFVIKKTDSVAFAVLVKINVFSS